MSKYEQVKNRFASHFSAEMLLLGTGNQHVAEERCFSKCSLHATSVTITWPWNLPRISDWAHLLLRMIMRVGIQVHPLWPKLRTNELEYSMLWVGMLWKKKYSFSIFYQNFIMLCTCTYLHMCGAVHLTLHESESQRATCSSQCALFPPGGSQGLNWGHAGQQVPLPAMPSHWGLLLLFRTFSRTMISHKIARRGYLN